MDIFSTMPGPRNFQNNPAYDIKIIFAVLDDKILATGEEALKEIVGDEKIEDSVIRWCQKYSVLFSHDI